MAESQPEKLPLHVRPMELRDLSRVTDVAAAAFYHDELFIWLFPKRDEFPMAWRKSITHRLRRRLFESGTWPMVCVPSPHAYDHDTIMGYAVWQRHPGTSNPDSSDAEKRTDRRNDAWTTNHDSWMDAINRKLLKIENTWTTKLKLDQSADYNALRTFEETCSDDEAVFGPLYAGVRHWHLAGLATHPDHQRRGVGRLLTQWGVERAREESQRVGFSIPCTLTASAMGSMVYPKLGFKIIDWMKVPDEIWAICEGDEGSAFVWDIDNTWIQEAPPGTTINGRRVEVVWTERAKKMLKDKKIKGNELLGVGESPVEVEEVEKPSN